MNMFDALSRALDNRGPIYSPYTFKGNWTPDEQKVIESTIRVYAPDKVDAGFNDWLFLKSGSIFMAKRATWDGFDLGEGTPERLAQQLDNYYSRY